MLLEHFFGCNKFGNPQYNAFIIEVLGSFKYTITATILKKGEGKIIYEITNAQFHVLA